MTTFLVIVIVGVLWYYANLNYERTNEWRYRRKRSAYAWSGVGALVGSFFGVAGFSSAIAGTLPGAFIGYLIASNLMKSDVDPRDYGAVDDIELDYVSTRKKEQTKQSSTTAHLLPESAAVVECPTCRQRLRVPNGKNLRVTCSKCKGVFDYKGKES